MKKLDEDHVSDACVYVFNGKMFQVRARLLLALASCTGVGAVAGGEVLRESGGQSRGHVARRLSARSKVPSQDIVLNGLVGSLHTRRPPAFLHLRAHTPQNSSDRVKHSTLFHR